MEQLKTSSILIRHIKKWIELNNINQNQFAKKMNKNPVTISRWLNGERQMSLKHLDQLSKITDIESNRLIDPKLKMRAEYKIIIE
jgi:transcriptional regulator with XRE-family HTH domain|tara:strand:+ start:426 stop:680 length:255 start_codon:yes stop_codon:yes gene_type:complete